MRFSLVRILPVLILSLCCSLGVVAGAEEPIASVSSDLAAREADALPSDSATLRSALRAAEERVRSYFVDARAPYPPAALTFIALKQQARLEVWAGDGAEWTFIRSYPIRAASGALGPKLRRGDHQVPEGIYRVVGLNPKSSFYLSLRLDYPNAFDRAKGRADERGVLGGDIMIHGGRFSDGCLPVGDGAVEELYALTQRAGAEQVSVVISPTDLRRTTVHDALLEAGMPLPWLGDLYGAIAAALDGFPLHSKPDRPLLARALEVREPRCKPYELADCTRRCDQGDVASCARAGLMYRDGRGAAPDTAQAWSFLSKACAGADALGCAELGLLHLDDHGLRRDAARAAELARSACEAGEGHGCVYLANLCLDRSIYPATPGACGRDEVRRLTEKAVATLDYSCGGWAAYDCDTLAEIYMGSDPATALRFASGSCKGGDSGGCARLGRLLGVGAAAARDPTPRAWKGFNARIVASRH